MKSTPESGRGQMIPVWFFIGVLLLIYGIIIFAVGVTEFSHPAQVVLSREHLTFWGGILLIVIGGFYTIHFWPGRSRKDSEDSEEGRGTR